MLKDKGRELISPLMGYLNTASLFAPSLLPGDVPSLWTRVSAAEGTFKYHKPAPVLGSSPEDRMTHLQRRSL